MIYIYTRVSTLGQADKGDSIDIQISKCVGWAKYRHPDVEYKIFEEKAISGSMPMKDRPQGSIVFNEIKEGDIFISYKLDRAFRNTQDALLVAEEFKKRGVGLVLMNMSENDMNTDSIGKLIFTILAAVGEMERETIRDRMKEGKIARKKKGGYVGGRVPYGWDSVDDPENKDRKIAVKNDAAQLTINELSKWIAAGKTYQSFADKMDAEGIKKNPSAWCKILKRETK